MQVKTPENGGRYLEHRQGEKVDIQKRRSNISLFAVFRMVPRNSG